MSADWPVVQLKDVTTILGDGLHGTPKYDDNGDYFFINGNNLCKGKIVISETTKRTNHEEYIKHRKNINDRTILVSINGTLGNVAFYNNEKVILGKSACYFNVKDDVNKHFVRYIIESKIFQDYIHSLATGSTIKNVSLKLMREFSFRLPPRTIQDDIAKILKSLDDKIHLNTQTNQTLESIAQAIFKSWFVDFEPVKAKMAVLAEGGTREQAELAAMGAISGKSEAELAQLQQQNPEHYQQLAETAALFPSAMVESELGEIPEGWASFEMSELVKQIKPGTNYQPKRQESGIPFVNGKHVQNGFLDFSSEPTNITVEEYERVHKSWKPEKNDVLITRIGTLGRVGIVTEYDLPMALHYNSICIKEGKIKHPFIFFLLRSDFFQYYYHLYKKQAVQEFVTIDAVEGIKIILPINKNDLDALTNIFDSFIQLMKKNHFETINLKSIRDSLLPKLLSGEIDLSDIQSEVA